MKEKIVTVVSEFTDFKGIIHKFVVAAVSEPIDAEVEIFDDGEVINDASISKTVKLG